MMMNKMLTGLLLFYLSLAVYAQVNNGVIDTIEELAEKRSIAFTMPDGTNLMTDIYLPVLQDSVSMTIPFSATDSITVQLMAKGSQYILYDSINGEKAEDPYQLPVIFMRTPYNKASETIGNVMAFLGYAVIIQDNRGAYASEGVYLPMYSDSWNKMPYHPNIKHSLDITDLDDPANANKHEDGYNSIQIINQLERTWEDTSLSLSNGNIGMIGASALGNVQYQLASAHKINPDAPGIKALMPIVASNEHYRFTAVQNGVFRQQLVKGWISGQYQKILDEDRIDADTGIMNSLHTPADFNKNDKMAVAEEAIDYWTTHKPGNQLPGYYPNSFLRSDLDASFAPVNREGEGTANGTYSRYTNMNAPMYHLTGWWDIFIDGQVETYNKLMQHMEDTSIRKLQKLVIGPWAHQTITERKTGDLTYPENVQDFLYDLLSLDTGLENLPLESLFESDIMHWFRYNLHFNHWKKTGLPKVVFQGANEWKAASSLIQYKFPSRDYVIPYHHFLNFLAGKDSLKNIPFTYKIFSSEIRDSIDIAPLSKPMLNLEKKIEAQVVTDFTKVPNVRFYVVGPQHEGTNQNTGNYWFKTDSFPFQTNIHPQDYYLRDNGKLSLLKPGKAEGFMNYIHDPDNPVGTAGGANMISRTPETGRKNQGQMNLASGELKGYSMERPDVLAFESDVIEDSLSVIGFPEATIYAKSKPLDNYSDSTDTDFFVRILDVYPTGETYFVAEGAVNARARNYAAQIAAGEEDPTIPFTNIASGQLYQYHFKMMPMAYTFGEGHKMKVLISSSNYPRYQSNPGIPLEPGTFFRREPNDGQSYTFRGKKMQPRKTEQTIFLNSLHSSKITLPVYGNVQQPPTDVEDIPVAARNSAELTVYPNPTSRYIHIVSGSMRNTAILYNISGWKIKEILMDSSYLMDLQEIPAGIYLLKLINLESGKRAVKKIIKK